MRWPEHALVAVVDIDPDVTTSLPEDAHRHVVEVGDYTASGYFECYDIQRGHRTLYCAPWELAPKNRHTIEYMYERARAEASVYDEEVFNLRDALDEIGVAVTADAVSEWTSEQRKKIWIYIEEIHAGDSPTKPKELS